MRLVWTSDNADQFRAFCNFLQAKSITFTTEEQVVSDWSSEQYGTRKYLLWITDEDQAEACIHWLNKFTNNPQAPEFATISPTIRSTSSVTQYIEQRLRRPIITQDEDIKKEFSGHMRLTAFVILLCSLIFLADFYTQKRLKSVPNDSKQEQITLSPIHKTLLFDYPSSYDLFNKIVLLYGIDALNHPQDLPEAGRFLYSEFIKRPAFMGYYPYILSICQQKLGQEPIKTVPLSEVTLIEKIREGELWRLISPVVLHVDILHLFFNMIWVLLLGTQIEARIGSFRLLLLMLISGVVSNTGQYLMSGPNFVGFSGIICAMATYIRTRQQVAPWEAYQMSSSTYAFIMFFISILALLSMVTFLLRVFQDISLPFAIANTAHIVGAIMGYCLGRISFFSWQLHR